MRDGLQSRRQFLAGIGGLGISLASTLALGGCSSLPFQSHRPATVPRIGVLSGSDPGDTDRIEPFKQGLTDLGYVDGQTVHIDWRFAEGDAERLPDLAAELVRLPVDVLVTLGATPAARAAMRATDSIPVVFVGVGDPVSAGLVASLAHPGGNVTGISNALAMTSTKRVEVLKDALPGAKRFDLLINPDNPVSLLHPDNPTGPEDRAELEELGRVRSMTFKPIPMRGPQDFDAVFGQLARDRPDGIVLYGDAVFNTHVKRLAELAYVNRLPSLFPFRQFAVAGGLVTYGISLTDVFKRGAYFVDRILKGAKPAELPAEHPAGFELVVNLRTAQALGLTLPEWFLKQANEVIQ
jgi:putative ABC transport system substrate-binding protein